MLPVIDAQCTYRESARYDDEVEVRTIGALLSPVRVQFTYEIVRPADQATLATTHLVIGYATAAALGTGVTVLFF